MDLKRRFISVFLIFLFVTELTPFPLIAQTVASTETILVEGPPETPGQEPDGGGAPPAESLTSSSENDPIYGPERSSEPSHLSPESSKFDGSYRYEIPIESPPGRNGLDPRISLQYSSSASDDTSVLGYGWSVNIPYIERINRRGANRMFNDKFFYSSLDGELVASSTSGSVEEFGALVENGDFRKYDLVSGSYWRITDKSGTLYTFGNVASAQLVDTASSTRVYRWYLNEIRDTNGNYISYSYAKDGAAIYPSTVTYTHGTGISGVFEVSFLREMHPTHATSSLSGFPVVWRDRVNEIQAKVNGSWVRKYVLGYGAGDNGVRNMLTSVTESGRDEALNTVTLPATTFSYSRSSVGFTFDSSWVMPTYFVNTISGGAAHGDMGVRFDDFNGDGWMDMLRGYHTTRDLFLNNRIGSWSTSTPTGSDYFTTFYGLDLNVRAGDLTADGLADLVAGQANGGYVRGNVGKGTSFTDLGWTVPANFSRYIEGNTTYDVGGRLFDVNGDGLLDLVVAYEGDVTYSAKNGIYLNNGSGWDATSTYAWTIPSGVFFAGVVAGVGSGVDYGVRFGDFNGDGFADIIQGRVVGASPYVDIYLNDGDGTWTLIEGPGGTSPFVDGVGTDLAVRVADINGDGLTDIIKTDDLSNTVRINKDGGYTFVDGGWGAMPTGFLVNGDDDGSRLLDVNGDNLTDIVKSNGNSASQGTGANGAYLHGGTKPDLLQNIVTKQGGVISATYKPTTKITDNGNAANPNLPFVIYAVDAVGKSDSLGTVGTTTNFYGGGEYYFAGPFNRRFAGFATTTQTEPDGRTVKTYFHQGNSTLSSLGENADDDSKIGKAYRTDILDGSGSLFERSVRKWEHSGLSSTGEFVRLGQETVLSYDGDGDHRDRATTFSYEVPRGNLITATDFGEVTASDDGSFTDTGSDKRTTTYTYAASSTLPLMALPSSIILVDQSSVKASETKRYYDNLSFGSASKGNETKTELWKTGTSYASTTRTYNTYGLVTQETDPRGKITIYTIDTNNLYPATTTNPLSQATGFLYNYAIGKAKQVTDPNNRVSQFTFDGLGRLTERKIPDSVSGLPVTQSVFTYTDTGLPRKVQETRYLNSATSTDLYTYFDGLARTIQERTEFSTTYSAKDKVYNSSGLLHKESLPYFSSGTAWTSPTTAANLLVTYAYDPLRRITSILNIKGTETHAYDQWKETITDRNGEVKDLTQDAYGNLAQVDEHNGASTYTSAYTYDPNNNLKKITDALGNVRNFVYDGLSRFTSSEDLHASADGTFGTTNFTYDDSGNLTSKTDPKSQTVNFTYNDINQILTEDFTGQSGTEITYTYNSCGNGKGRLCVASSTDARLGYAYNPTGQISTASTTLAGTPYTSSFSYDRQGNFTDVTYPDNSIAKYGYDTAGLLDTALRKPANSSLYLNAVTELDYAPTGAISLKRLGNGTVSNYTFDANALYRLTNILTTSATSTAGGALGLLFNKMSRHAFAPFAESPLATAAEQLLALETLDENPVNTVSADVISVSELITETPAGFHIGLSSKEASGGEAVVLAKKDKPEIRLTKWDREVDLGVSYPTLDAKATYATSSGRMEWKGEKEEVHAYALPAAAGMEDGGVEIEVVLKEKPRTNTFSFAITGAENLEFFYQPELSKEESQEGAARPENIVGSYAVYHKAKTGKREGVRNYSTGKVFHIYRPTIIDAEGKSVWGTLEYADGTLSVTVPQGFLSSARYPVRVDPTFGYTSVGASTFIVGASKYGGSLFTAPADYGSFTSMSVYCGALTSNEDIKAMIVVHSNLNIATNGVSNAVNCVAGSPAWKTGTFATSPTLTASTEYVLGAIHSSNRAQLYYDTGSTDQGHYDTSNNYTTPQNLGTATHSTRKFSAYVTYSASGGNQAPTSPSALLAEGATNPTNISDPTPELSAIYNDPDSGDLANKYRIQVATSSSFTPIFYDSGTTTMATTTAGMRSPDLSYAGPALASSTTYYWRIKFWDQALAEGAWSTTTDTFSLAAGGGGSGNPFVPILQNISYTYDNVGNITQLTDNSGSGAAKTTVFGYDDLHRLLSASTTAASSTPYLESYAYNALGNFTSKTGQGTYTYAGTNYANPHAPTTVGSTAQTYDNNGNLTAASPWGYAWDYRNRLTSAGNGTATSTYAYDADNQRVRQVVAGITTLYPNKYFSKAGATTTAYLFLPNGDLIATIEGNGTATTTNYVHADHLGSTNAVSAGNGTMAQAIDYYPYGTERFTTGTNSTDRHFIGERFDSASGLNYLNNRYYKSAQGQFLSEDPVFLSIGTPAIEKLTGQSQRAILSDPQITNSYSYARDNPIRFKDPQGLYLETPLELGLLAFDAGMVARSYFSGGDTREQLGYLGLDAAGLAIPGGGVGLGVRSIKTASNVSQSKTAAEIVARSAELGKFGEQVSGISKNTERIPSLTGTAKYRTPDLLNHAAKVIGDVKYANYQSLTPQMRDFIAYAKQNNYSFNLITRTTTQISQPLANALGQLRTTLKKLDSAISDLRKGP